MYYFTHTLAITVLWLLITGCASRATRFDSISVRGPAAFRQEITNTLTLLKTKSPASYATITNDVAVVRTGAHVGMYPNTQTSRLELPAATPADSITWRAGVIAHFAYHSHLYRRFLREHAGINCVPYDEYRWRDAEKRCLEFQLAVLQEVGAPPSELTRAGTDPHTVENRNPTHP